VRRSPIAHIVFPYPHAERPVAEFVWDAVRHVSEAPDLDVEVLMPVPLAPARAWASRLRTVRGAAAWPDELEAILAKLDPKPTLVRYVPLPRRSIESATAAIATALIARRRARRPVVLHGSFLDQGGYAAAVAARALDASALVVAHGTDVRMARTGDDSGRARRARATLRYAHQVLCVSSALAGELAHLGRHAEVVRYGADDRRFTLGPKAPQPALVLFVGRLSRAKGVDLLLEAFAALAHTDARLRLVGPAGDVDVDTLARRYGIAERVERVGEVPHDALAAHYHQASVLVLPSRSEGFGCVLAEALLCGRPIVTTQVGGMVEIASSAVGDTVPGDDPRALAVALDRVLDARFDPAALRRAGQAYAWSTHAPKLLAHTRALLAGGAPADALR
jgi:glycosyltransferase involved in cell wall biosynthesis